MAAASVGLSFKSRHQKFHLSFLHSRDFDNNDIRMHGPSRFLLRCSFFLTLTDFGWFFHIFHFFFSLSLPYFLSLWFWPLEKNCHLESSRDLILWSAREFTICCIWYVTKTQKTKSGGTILTYAWISLYLFFVIDIIILFSPMFCAILIGFLDLKVFISRFASIKRRFSFFQLFLCFHDFDPFPIARHLPTKADTNELQSAETNEQRRRLFQNLYHLQFLSRLI